MRIVTFVSLLLLTAAVAANAGELPGTSALVAHDSTSQMQGQNDIVAPISADVIAARRTGPTEYYNDSVCATMRTYMVARTHRNSDSTRIVGYARCQPAWKFQLRTAEHNIPDSRER
jgi:hypothetical protein